MNRGLRRRVLYAGIAILALGIAGCASQSPHLERGRQLALQGKWDEAFASFQAAQLSDPSRLETKLELERARPRAAEIHLKAADSLFQQGKHDDALVEYQLALAIDPGLQRAQVSIMKIKNYQDAEFFYQKGLDALKDREEVRATRFFRKVTSLNPTHKGALEALERLKNKQSRQLDSFEIDLKSREPITLKFRDASLKEVLAALSKASGINFIYDEAFKDFKVTIELEKATFKQALDLIFLTNPIFYKAVTRNTVLVVPKTPAKVRQYEDLKVKTFYLNNMDVKKATALLRSILKTTTIYTNEELNAIMVRADPTSLILAEKTLEANDLPVAEVVLDVEVIEISREKRRELGLELSRFAITGQIGRGIPASPTDITQLNQLLLESLAGNRFVFITLPSVTYRFLKSVTDAKLLSNPTIRVANAFKASIHVGERVPFVTSTVTPGGTISETVTYIDVGIKLDVQPSIHLDSEVSSNIRLEVSAIGAEVRTATSVAFRQSTRTASTLLTLREGQTQIIGGLVSDEERTTTRRIAGLGDIPILGWLFKGQDKTTISTEILLSITPHVVRTMPLPPNEVTEFWSGTETEFSTRPLFQEEDGSSSLSDGSIPSRGEAGSAPVQGPRDQTQLPSLSGDQAGPSTSGRPAETRPAAIRLDPPQPKEQEAAAAALGDSILTPTLPASLPAVQLYDHPLYLDLEPAREAPDTSSLQPSTSSRLRETGTVGPKVDPPVLEQGEFAPGARKDHTLGPPPGVALSSLELYDFPPGQELESRDPTDTSGLQSSYPGEGRTDLPSQEALKISERPKGPEELPPEAKPPLTGGGPPQSSAGGMARLQPDGVTPGRPERGFYVQVGSFKVRARAEELAEQLTQKGHQSFVEQPSVNPGELWFRVRLGPYSTWDEAREVARRLNSHKGSRAFVGRLTGP